MLRTLSNSRGSVKELPILDKWLEIGVAGEAKLTNDTKYNAPRKAHATAQVKKELRIVRVLIAIAPTMYWETLELALLRYRPHLDVRIAGPDALDRETISFEPHLVVCNEVTPTVRESVPSWVAVPYHHSSDATIHVQGQGESNVEDIAVGDLFKVIDRTEALLSDTHYPET